MVDTHACISVRLNATSLSLHTHTPVYSEHTHTTTKEDEIKRKLLDYFMNGNGSKLLRYSSQHLDSIQVCAVAAAVVVVAVVAEMVCLLSVQHRWCTRVGAVLVTTSSNEFLLIVHKSHFKENSLQSEVLFRNLKVYFYVLNIFKHPAVLLKCVSKINNI